MLWRPVVSEPQLCTLKELEDGTYSINDLMDMHEILDLKEEILRRARSKSEVKSKNSRYGHG